MKTTLRFLFTFSLLIKFVAAQTTVTILGTAHFATQGMNADTLYQMICRIKPDVILQELDASLMDAKGNYKGRILKDTGNEHLASLRYKVIHPDVVFREFDIAYRNAYYRQHNTFANENKSSRSLDSLFSRGLLSRKNLDIISKLYHLNDSLNRMYYDSQLRFLNSPAYMSLAREREFWLYTKLPEVFESTPALHKWHAFEKDDADFWDVRNHAMINNILGYVGTFKGKKIMVLTGAMHKYYLTEGLQPKQAKYHFKLLDLPQ
jgi:hypothetical protein